LIRDNGYNFADYHNYGNIANPCILRHDIDFDVEKALRLAKLEYNNSVTSTYFVLLNTNFYNVFSSTVNKMLKEIMAMGHEIGLHFDEIYYSSPQSINWLVVCIQKEIVLLEYIIENQVKAVSMHRPSQSTLKADIVIPHVVNSYSQVFFKEFKYISDSRHCWRENAEDIILSQKHEKLHLLTHPFWYTEQTKTCKDKLSAFVTAANRKRYEDMNNNFRDLNEFIPSDEIGKILQCQ
jgi:hypothetical protein